MSGVSAEVSPEAMEVIRSMVAFCLDQGACMGPDEGFVERTDRLGNPVRMRKRKFRKEIEDFCGYGSGDTSGPPQTT